MFHNSAQKPKQGRGGGLKSSTSSNKFQPFTINHLSNLIILPVAFLLWFLLSFIAGSLIVRAQPTKAITGLTLVTIPVMTLTSNTNTMSLSITPTIAGTITSSSQTLTASTNVPAGYQLSISTPTVPAYTPTTGTLTSPTHLANNTWGYALPKVATGTASNIIINDFDPTYTTPTPTATSRWANPSITTTIKHTTDSTSSLPASATTTVYYAVKADFNQASGTYINNVRYTATANINNIPLPVITSTAPTTGTTAGGGAITIIGTGFTVNDQSVTTGVTIDDTPCQNVNIASNTPTTGQDTITCATPIHATTGVVAVSVATWAGTAIQPDAYTYVAPTATITAPVAGQILAVGTTSTTLSVTTDMPAICYYGAAINPTTQMANTGNNTTGATTHSQDITGLTNISINTRYVRCQAQSGHAYGVNENVIFYVKAATPATPTLTPASNAAVGNGTTTITVVSATAGSTCTWGTSSATATINASGTTRTTTTGANTLYYSCVVSSGNTVSDARTGSWSYTGVAPKTYIQTINMSNCPTTRTKVNDARDDATYWIQKLADGKCWMLTNLAYGGYGTNTYGDVKYVSEGSSVASTRTAAYYYIPAGSNRTSGAMDPSISTNGTGQYGYLYNWCAAMGVQAGTGACLNAVSPYPNTSISICPTGWRLPTGGGGEFAMLNNIVNGGSTYPTALLSTWLGMYSGYWDTVWSGQGAVAMYWSSSQYSAASAYATMFTSYQVRMTTGYGKQFAHAVRCVAL